MAEDAENDAGDGGDDGEEEDGIRVQERRRRGDARGGDADGSTERRRCVDGVGAEIDATGGEPVRHHAETLSDAVRQFGRADADGVEDSAAGGADGDTPGAQEEGGFGGDGGGEEGGAEGGGGV